MPNALNLISTFGKKLSPSLVTLHMIHLNIGNIGNIGNIERSEGGK